MTRIGFIGAGQMAAALGKGCSKCEMESVEFIISDPSSEAIERFRATVGNQNQVRIAESNQAAAQSDIVFLAVKPQYLYEALEGIEFPPETLVISIVAGVMILELVRIAGTEQVVRVMPNTPCLIGRGASGIAAHESVSDEKFQVAKRLMESSGICLEIAEELMDSVTGISGSGPAYVYTFVESLIDAGVLTGLSRDVSRQLALQTVMGAVEMLASSGEHPAVLRDRVTSPGGTTISAMKAMEETGFRDSVMSAVMAATQRAQELGGQ